MSGSRTVVIVLALASSLTATSGSAAPLLSDAALVCAQNPASAAFDAANSQVTPDDPNPGNAACGQLCQKWVGTCKGLVASMKACWLGAVGRIGALRNAECSQLDGGAKDNCKAAVKAEKDAAKQFIKSDSELGRSFCEAQGLANCISNCA